MKEMKNLHKVAETYFNGTRYFMWESDIFAEIEPYLVTDDKLNIIGYTWDNLYDYIECKYGE